MQTEEKKLRQKDIEATVKNCLWKCFHSFKYVIDQANVCFFFLFPLEGVYVTIGNPAFCLLLYLTGIYFQGKLQDDGDISQQKIKCCPIRTRDKGGVPLSDVLYVFEPAPIH